MANQILNTGIYLGLLAQLDKLVCSQLGRQEKRIVRERRWESGKNWE